MARWCTSRQGGDRSVGPTSTGTPGPPEVRRLLSEASGGSLASETICLVTLTLRAVSEDPLCLCCFRPPSVWNLTLATLGRHLSMHSSRRTHQPAGPRPLKGGSLRNFLWPRSFYNPIKHFYSMDFKSEANKVGNIKELVQFIGLFTRAEIQMQAVGLKTHWTRLPHWVLPVWWESNNNNNNSPG